VTADARAKTPRGLTRDVRADWLLLASPTQELKVFDPSSLAQLPEPARRWLCHAIVPGTPLARTAEIWMHGPIRLGDWRPFTAVQRLTPREGFVWAATARLLGLPVVGFDRYTRGSGQMRWRLRNLLPVMRADGPDITRSAAERHAGELLLYVPTAAVDGPIAWRAVDEDHATVRVQLESAVIDVTITVASNGALSGLVLSRWGNPDGTSFTEHIFGAAFKDEVAFGGVTLPREVTRAGITAPLTGRKGNSSATASPRPHTPDSYDSIQAVKTRPPVERVHPPDALLRMINPLMRRLIARGRFGHQLLLLHYVGRRSGRRFDVPAGYSVIDGVVSVLTNSGWRHNFAGGRDIEVTMHGRRRPAYAVLVDDPQEVTDVYERLIDELGIKQARRRLGLRFNVDRVPTRSELQEAIQRSGLSLVRIHDQNPRSE
jgi:hypothetical protein